MKTFNIGIDKIDKIYHLADIHIRNLKRHQEYKTVFERTVNAIKATIGPNDIIFLIKGIAEVSVILSSDL